jgi:hypothetical protein
MAKGDSHMAKNVAKESCCIAPTLEAGQLDEINWICSLPDIQMKKKEKVFVELWSVLG